MKMIRAVSSGIMIWAFVFGLFMVLSFIPGIKTSEILQGLVVFVFVIPFTSWAATFYYKTGAKTSGLITGLIAVATAVFLDAVITVPFVEIPYNGSSYVKFFSNPFLWILIAENILIFFFYWRLRVKSFV